MFHGTILVARNVPERCSRFRVQVRVQDCTGVVTLTLFDRDVNKLLQKSAKELLEQDAEACDADVYPIQLNDLLDKKLAFHIDIRQYNLDKKCPIYGVLKLSDDAKTIYALEKKFDGEQDVVSSTGDNATPVSVVEKSTGARTLLNEKTSATISKHSALKRNLDNVFDVYETTSMSSTKPRTNSMGDRVSEGNKKLTRDNDGEGEKELMGNRDGEGKKRLFTPKLEK